MSEYINGDLLVIKKISIDGESDIDLFPPEEATDFFEDPEVEEVNALLRRC